MNKELRIEKQNGVATLPIVFVLAFLILMVVISIASVSFNESVISQGTGRSAKALVYAEAGARDALIRISRDKNYSGYYLMDMAPSGCSADEGCVRITVSSGIGTETDPKIINAEGRVKNNIRKIQTNVVFDSSLNGQITNIQWQEITD